MLQAIVTRRFHDCLKDVRRDHKNRMAELSKMEDHELVHKFCRKERLTLFNFLKMHEASQHRTNIDHYEQSEDANPGNSATFSLNEERIKALIHGEYVHYLRPHMVVNGPRGKEPVKLDIYRGRRTSIFKTEGIINDLKKSVKIETGWRPKPE